MTENNSLEQSILNSLFINLNYSENETVGILYQKPPQDVSKELELKFQETINLSKKLFETFKNNNVDVELFYYTPRELRNGVDAPKELYDLKKDILFMPTAFSLSHTDFRKHLSSKGTRIASMPGFTLKTFEDVMNVDYNKIETLTNSYATKMKENKYVKITAYKTKIIVELNNDLVKSSSGILNKKGQFGNLPGAETYNVPLSAKGHITIPKGFGGKFPLEYDITFTIEDGRFTKIDCENEEYGKQIWKENFEKENFNILAELGIGTNPKITSSYIKKTGWSTLLAEKIYGSVHFANGNNYAMGGENNVPIHIDWVVPDAEIEFVNDFNLF